MRLVDVNICLITAKIFFFLFCEDLKHIFKIFQLISAFVAFLTIHEVSGVVLGASVVNIICCIRYYFFHKKMTVNGTKLSSW